MLDGPPKALCARAIHTVAGAKVMDSQLAYDTLLVAWVLGMALYLFSLGKLLGASGWPGRG